MKKLDDMTERELIEFAQERLGEIKSALRRVRQINEGAERAAAANAAFLTLSELNVWHGRATERMLEHWPNFAAEVVILGPGGR
jgi:hypothetical protein